MTHPLHPQGPNCVTPTTPETFLLSFSARPLPAPKPSTKPASQLPLAMTPPHTHTPALNPKPSAVSAQPTGSSHSMPKF